MIKIRPISTEYINDIVALVQFINQETSKETLTQRFHEMFTQNYECIGVFDNDRLIGCAGLWFQTRHYSGKSAEPDHVVIMPEYRNRQIGKNLMEYCKDYARSKFCETIELNCYIRNTAGQEFWESIGFQKLGYHSVHKL